MKAKALEQHYLFSKSRDKKQKEEDKSLNIPSTIGWLNRLF